MASEVGVLDVPAERVLEKRRLQPGRMFLVDTSEGRIISDEEIKEADGSRPAVWRLAERIIWCDSTICPTCKTKNRRSTIRRRCNGCKPSVTTSKICGSISARWRKTASSRWVRWARIRHWRFCPTSRNCSTTISKQLFAQVTNPPIDPIREELITSTTLTLGSEGNLIDPNPQSCRQLRLPEPILKNSELEKLRQIDHAGNQVSDSADFVQS